MAGLALFLDCRRVDPVLGVEDHGGTFGLRLQHALDAGERALARRLLGDLADVEIGTAVAEIAGQRFLDHRVDAAFERGDGDGLMGRGTGADVHHLDGVEQRLERLEGREATRLGEAPGVLRGRRKDSRKLDLGPVGPPNALVMQLGGEARPDDPAPHPWLAGHM
jgi:hypothetical protein